MIGPIGFFLAMFLPPLLIAFVAQFFVTRQRRAKLIGWTGLGWVAALALMSRESSGSAAGLVIGILFLLVLGGILALAGAIAGSELSTLVQRLSRGSARE